MFDPSWEFIYGTDETQFACDGHVTNSPEVLSTLAHAYAHEAGIPMDEAWDSVVRVRLHHGHVGRADGIYDDVTCDADGNWPGVDDGEPACTNVRATTWAYLPSEPASSAV